MRSTTPHADERGPTRTPDRVEAAFSRHAPDLLRYLYGMTGSLEDAEDLLGDVFTQAWRYRRRIEQIDHWLFRVARNAAYRLLKRRRAEPSWLGIDGFVDGDVRDRLRAAAVAEPTTGPSAFDDRAPVIAALFELSARDRDILILHGLFGHPMSDVALHLEVSEQAAWQRWQRARNRFFALLVAHRVEPPDGWRRPREAGDRIAAAGDSPTTSRPDSQAIPPAARLRHTPFSGDGAHASDDVPDP